MTLHQPLSAPVFQRSAPAVVPFTPTQTRAEERRTPPAPPASPEPERESQRRPRRLNAPVAWLLAAAIPSVIVISLAVEPAPDGPQPVAPLWANLLGNATAVAALVAIGGLIAVQRFGVWLAGISGLGLVTMAATCPLSGHHLTGSFLYIQLGISAALVAASALVLARYRAPTG